MLAARHSGREHSDHTEVIEYLEGWDQREVDEVAQDRSLPHRRRDNATNIWIILRYSASVPPAMKVALCRYVVSTGLLPPGARLSLYDGCGHSPFQEQPDSLIRNYRHSCVRLGEHNSIPLKC
jgi:pimeloyl-ACP methyl ester carboxylesterase